MTVYNIDTPLAANAATKPDHPKPGHPALLRGMLRDHGATTGGSAGTPKNPYSMVRSTLLPLPLKVAPIYYQSGVSIGARK